MLQVARWQRGGRQRAGGKGWFPWTIFFSGCTQNCRENVGDWVAVASCVFLLPANAPLATPFNHIMKESRRSVFLSELDPRFRKIMDVVDGVWHGKNTWNRSTYVIAYVMHTMRAIPCRRVLVQNIHSNCGTHWHTTRPRKSLISDSIRSACMEAESR